jgi:transposase
MNEYIALDAHRRYSWVDREDHSGKSRSHRLDHAPGAVRGYLSACAPGTPVAVEATGNWYWIIDEIEQAHCEPRLVHARKAKLMMGLINKTDRLDAQGLNRLQRNGTLPTVWIPPWPLRDLRELTRSRLVLTAERTRLKNRMLATLAKYGTPPSERSDRFSRPGREELIGDLQRLPEQTRWVSGQMLAQLDFVNGQIQALEQRLEQLVEVTEGMQLLMTLPGVAEILGATIALEIGEVSRFPSAAHLASYAGTTPRVHASGGKVRYGPVRHDVNRYLKWAFAEAANSVAVNYRRHPERHVSRLYQRVRSKGHAKAVGAVARHLAEAAFHVLSKKQAYRDPLLERGCTNPG